MLKLFWKHSYPSDVVWFRLARLRIGRVLAPMSIMFTETVGVLSECERDDLLADRQSFLSTWALTTEVAVST